MFADETTWYMYEAKKITQTLVNNEFINDACEVNNAIYVGNDGTR